MDSDVYSATKVAALGHVTLNFIGAATSVADRTLHRAGSKFSHCEMESETQRRRKIQTKIERTSTIAIYFEGEL